MRTRPSNNNRALNPWGARYGPNFRGTQVVPQDLSPILNPNPVVPAQQSIQVLDRVVLEDQNLFVRWVGINVTAAGTTTIVNAVGGRKLTVVSIEFVVSVAVSVAWLSAGTTVRPAQAFAANSGIARDIVRPYYVQTNPGEALGINLSGVANVIGALGYVEVGT